MDTSPQRVAITSGGGDVPGLNAVVTGAILWERTAPSETVIESETAEVTA